MSAWGDPQVLSGGPPARPGSHGRPSPRAARAARTQALARARGNRAAGCVKSVWGGSLSPRSRPKWTLIGEVGCRARAAGNRGRRAGRAELGSLCTARSPGPRPSCGARRGGGASRGVQARAAAVGLRGARGSALGARGPGDAEPVSLFRESGAGRPKWEEEAGREFAVRGRAWGALRHPRDPRWERPGRRRGPVSGALPATCQLYCCRASESLGLRVAAALLLPRWARARSVLRLWGPRSRATSETCGSHRATRGFPQLSGSGLTRLCPSLLRWGWVGVWRVGRRPPTPSAAPVPLTSGPRVSAT